MWWPLWLIVIGLRASSCIGKTIEFILPSSSLATIEVVNYIKSNRGSVGVWGMLWQGMMRHRCYDNLQADTNYCSIGLHLRRWISIRSS